MPEPLWDQLMAQGQTPPSLWPDAAPVDPNYQRDPFEVAAQRVRQPYRNIAAPGSSNLGPIAEALAPTEPWEYGLMVAGPGPGLIGRGLAALPAAARLGAAAAGFALTPSEAQAGGKRELVEKLTGFAPFANPKLRSQADEIIGRYSQYAEKYPDIGPPELMWNLPDPDKPGKFLKTAGGTVPYKTLEEATAKAKEPGFFLEKKLTPEAEQFQKDRNIIQRDMDLHGYDPYFDPAKRFDVNPKHYGPFEDTAVTASPKTPAKRAEWDAKYGTDEIRARLQEGFKRGSQVPESDRWYLMGQLEQAYVKQLGPKAGRAAFEKEFADMMAATTGGAAPYDNYLMSHYANVINKQGERLPESGWQLPFPIGGRFASGNLKQAQKYIDQGNVDWPETNPKRYDFSGAFKGNKNAGTIDEQMMTAYDPSLKDKQPVWYGPATKTLREEAGKAGVDARGFQDVDWAGLKALKTEAKGKSFEYEGPMINQINRSIETTHRLTGMPREEIVRRGVILKEIPMYGLTGAVGTGAALAPALFGGDEAQAGPAKAVGDVLYHGTSKDKGFSSLRDARNGTWFSTNPKEASDYAASNDSMGFRWENSGPVKTNQASRVIPMTPKFEKTLDLDEWPKELVEATNYKKAQGEYFDKVRAKGYDSVRMKTDDGHSVVVSLDNSKLSPAYTNADIKLKPKALFSGAGALAPALFSGGDEQPAPNMWGR